MIGQWLQRKLLRFEGPHPDRKHCHSNSNMVISIENMEILEAPVYPAQTQLEAEYDKTVRGDIELFGQYITKFLAGEIDDNDFRAQRLRRGCYSQRQPGV